MGIIRMGKSALNYQPGNFNLCGQVDAWEEGYCVQGNFEDSGNEYLVVQWNYPQNNNGVLESLYPH